MPIFAIGKSFGDIEPHRYEKWGSISGSSLSGSVENSLSRSRRCFQIDDAGDVNGNQNYYSGTGSLTPGPGTYKVKRSDPQVGPYSPEFSFGNSDKERTLSESNRLWAKSDLSTPSPNAYTVSKSSTEDYLKNLLGVSRWKLKKSQRKLKTAQGLTNFDKRTLNTEINLLEKRIKAINNELSAIPPPVSPIQKNKNLPFGSSELKPYQKVVKIQEAPTFYMNEETEWDFGSRNRGLNVIDMSSFGYSKKFMENKDWEELTHTEVATGASSAKPRCRSTDFFGPNKALRNTVPSVGSYTPDLLPSNYPYGPSGTLKSREEGGSRFDAFSKTDGTLSSHTSWNTLKPGANCSFTFSRSASMKQDPTPSHLPKSPLNTTKSSCSNERYIGSKSRPASSSQVNRSRRSSKCSDVTFGSSLPSPTKTGRAKTSEGRLRGLFVSPGEKK